MGWANGRHALITGGGTGIGAATARMFAEIGAKVTLLGRRREPLEAVAAEFGGTVVACDITDRDALENAIEDARAANGPLDYVILNAGIADSAPFGRTSRESFDRIIATNLTAVFDGAQLALPDLLQGEDKRLVKPVTSLPVQIAQPPISDRTVLDRIAAIIEGVLARIRSTF